MKTSLRLLCGVLLTAFTLSGCAEQILDSASKDPAPTVTSGEEGTANTIAKFSTSDGLAPQPSDVVLANVNAALPPESQLEGVSRLMPIRIPFSGPLASLHHDNGSWNSTVGDQLKENLLIISTDNFLGSLGGLVNFDDQRISPIPTHDSHSSFPDGQFKVVYQDANHDLVLVPNSGTFEDNTTYIVAVRSNLGDAQGNNISPDVLTNILTNPLPIVVDGEIINSLFDDLETANSLEGLRASYAPLVGGLQALGQIESHNELAQLFTFTTELDNQSKIDGTKQLIGFARSKLAADVASDNITWATTYPSNASILDDQPANLKTTILNSLDTIIPSDNISAIYKGYFSCQNYLDNKGVDITTGWQKWELELQAKALGSTGSDCPNIEPELVGKIGFLIAKPEIVEGVVIFMHGLTDVKEDVFRVMNTFAQKNLATVVFDMWGHGERVYEDANRNEDLSDDSGDAFYRPDNPALSVGYWIQTQFDLIRFDSLLRGNLAVSSAINSTSNSTYLLGWSGGGIVSSSLINEGSFSWDRIVLNSPGAGAVDSLFSGSFGPPVRAAVAAGQGIDISTKDGQEELNSTMLGVELSATHAVFKGGIDPLFNANITAPSNVLVQEITGDQTVLNSNTEILSLAMGLTTRKDGDGAENSNRVRWIFNPINYAPTEGNVNLADHSSLVDWETQATTEAQKQAACFFKEGVVLDPSKEINITTCTNVN